MTITTGRIELEDGFPNIPLFEHLVGFGNQHLSTGKIVIKDHALNIEASCADLLAEVLERRQLLWGKLSPDVRRRLSDDEAVAICLVAPAGYEWVVGYLTIMSIGGVVVPLPADASEEKISHAVTETSAVVVLVGSLAQSTTVATKNLVDKASLPCLCIVLPIRENDDSPQSLPRPAEFRLSKKPLDLQRIGSILFTSGTTGPSKGVVHYRGSFVTSMLSNGWVGENDVAVHQTPGQLVTGLWGQLLFLLNDARTEYTYGIWSAQWMWEQLKTGRITCFINSSACYLALAEYYKTHLAVLPKDQRNEYTVGLQSLRVPVITGTRITSYLWDSWNAIPGSPPLVGAYGLTETFGLGSTFPGGKHLHINCIGRVRKETKVKLSHGNVGEMLLKCPNMFAGYLNEPELTARSFDEEGFLRTGDYCLRRESFYFILGRVSQDIMESNGCKFTLYEIEDAVHALPQVKDVFVVSVSDSQGGRRVAAIIQPTEEATATEGLSIFLVRQQLHQMGLATYKLPTLCHITDPKEVLPRTPMGKPMKPMAVRLYFPNDSATRFPDRVQSWTEEDIAKESLVSPTRDGQEMCNSISKWQWAGMGL